MLLLVGDFFLLCTICYLLTGRNTFRYDPEFRGGYDHQKLSETVGLLSGKNFRFQLLIVNVVYTGVDPTKLSFFRFSDFCCQA